MFNIENNGRHIQVAMEAMTDQEITTSMRGAQDVLPNPTISTEYRTLLRCIIIEGATELRKRWFPAH